MGAAFEPSRLVRQLARGTIRGSSSSSSPRISRSAKQIRLALYQQRQSSTAAVIQDSSDSPRSKIPSKDESQLRLLAQIVGNDIGGDKIWLRRLDEAMLDLQPRRKRISVYGNRVSGARDIVSALLQTPLVDSPDLLAQLEDRPSGLNRIEFGSSSTADLSIASTWLKSLDADLYEVSEVDDAISYLVRSDSVLIVVDPYRLLQTGASKDVPRSILNTSIIIVNGALPPHTCQSAIETEIRESLPDFRGSIYFTNACLAIEALKAYHTNVGVDRFQSLYNRSGIGLLQKSISIIQTADTSEAVKDLVIDYIESVVRRDLKAGEGLLETVAKLREAIRACTAKAVSRSVSSQRIDGGVIEGSVGHSEIAVLSRLDELFVGRLSWLALLFRLRVDDIGNELDGLVKNAFSEVEQQLVYEAGQLSQMQDDLSQKTDAVIRGNKPPFQSPSLVNRIATLSLSTPTIESGTLLEPIRRRRLQLRRSCVAPLYRMGRRIIAQTYLASVGGILSSWFAYVPPLELLSASTATACGLLAVAASFSWGQMRWMTAQRIFKRDWQRCTTMLYDDTKIAFRSALSIMVPAKTTAAADGLEQLARKRISFLDNILNRTTGMRKD